MILLFLYVCVSVCALSFLKTQVVDHHLNLEKTMYAKNGLFYKVWSFSNLKESF